MMINKLYGNTFFRISLKFTLSFLAMKAIYDLCHLFFLGRKVGLARSNQIYSGQNPINTPYPMAYPIPKTYEQLKRLKQSNIYSKRTLDTAFTNEHKMAGLYNDQPCRQNPDIVDHLIQYGNIYRMKQLLTYSFINNLKNQGIQIPQNINQKIRELSQHQLNFHTPIIPQL